MSHQMKQHIPNIISLSRIPLVVSLPFVKSSPGIFWIIYLLCGQSDVLDAAIARRTDTASRLRERLDTIADIVFVAVWMILFLPAINAGKCIWIWVDMIATVKFVNIVSGFIVLKAFATKHTLANKVTGILLFLLPMTIQVESIKGPSIILACSLATFAAIQEGHLIRKTKAE